MDDLQLIRRLKDGNIGGLEILVARYQCKAVHTEYLITHDEQLAEDAVQETFVRVYQTIQHINDACPFEPYLLCRVANTALNATEKSTRWVQFGAGIDLL